MFRTMTKQTRKEFKLNSLNKLCIFNITIIELNWRSKYTFSVILIYSLYMWKKFIFRFFVVMK